MKRKKEYKVIIYCLLLSMVIMFFSSKSSPFYPFNDWVDANAFFTVGKSMVKGIIPYKDLFEQKGPFLYLIFALASLISNTSFLGVFILEILFMTFTLYFCYLICLMFLSKKISLIVLPIFLVLMVTTGSYTHGSSCEEFMFLPQAISLYYFIRHFKERNLSKKEFMLNGFLAGTVLLMKYTSLGFWFAFQLSIIIDYLRKKEYKEIFTSSLFFSLGMFLPIIIVLVYFGINHAIKEFIYVYFVVNMTMYGAKVGVLEHFIRIFVAFFKSLFNNNILVILLVIIYPIMIYLMKIKKNLKIYLIILYFLTMFGIFYGLKDYCYYVLPINFFMLISLIVIFSFLPKMQLLNKYFIILIALLCFIISYFFSINKYFHSVKIEDLWQYHFAEILKKDVNASMVNMGFLDGGVYTLSGTYPSTYFFELQNFDYSRFPDNEDAFNDYIKNKKTKYIVYVERNDRIIHIDKKLLRENYDIISMEGFVFENQKFRAYLWKVKE